VWTLGLNAALKRYRVVPESHTTSQVEFLKRAAKKLARTEGILHSQALDRLAKERGYKNWSLLQKHAVPNPSEIHDQRQPVEEPATKHRIRAMSKISQQERNVLDEYELRNDDWTFGNFDNSLEQSMGASYGNYQTAKLTIIHADQEGTWPKTVERWIRSNYKAFGNLPVEMISIGQRFDL
jgi:hypothetical protein